MGKSGRRALVLRPDHLTTPDGDAVAHAARRELEPKIRPIGCARRVVEARLAVEAVEIGTDQLAVFHAHPGIVDQIGHAARGIDLIVGTARRACFRLDDLDAVLERLLDDDDAREAGIWRAVCDVDLHIQGAIQFSSAEAGPLLNAGYPMILLNEHIAFGLRSPADIARTCRPLRASRHRPRKITVSGRFDFAPRIPGALRPHDASL